VCHCVVPFVRLWFEYRLGRVSALLIG